MSVDKEFALNALLRHNYLPTTRSGKEELPPIYSSESFTPLVAEELAKLNPRSGGYDQVEFRLTRFNSVSRLLSLPHPTPHAKLCLALHEHWEKFEYIVTNKNSQIKPHAFDDGRIIIMNDYGGSVEKTNRQLNNAFGKRYRVSTDIANCFPSIYTHAVPWALVGQSEAKNMRPPKFASEWFNRIDEYLRSCRRGETQGIAIGPGTSNIVAEIILGRIDQEMRKQFDFVRYIDDYECHCDTESHAQEFVRLLELEAAKFKLQLNIGKTVFTRLPHPVSASWVVELGRHVPHGDSVETFDVFRFLDIAVGLAARSPDGSVLKYAASVVAGLPLTYPKNTDCLNYLLGLAFHHPDLLPKLQKLIEGSYLECFGTNIDLVNANSKLEAIVLESAARRHSDGMCWALFYLGRVNHVLSERAIAAVIATGDAFAILTMYWSSAQALHDVLRFCNSLDVDDVHELDSYWLLLYQVFLDGHIQNPYKGDMTFQILKDGKVTFLLPLSSCASKEAAATGVDL